MQAKVKFILLILYKYTLYRLKLKINANKQTNFDLCFLSINISKFLKQKIKFNCMFGTWYITYFLIISQMESEEGEEMEVARDVVMIPIRDRWEESVSPYSTEDGVTLIKITKRRKEEHRNEKFFQIWRWMFCHPTVQSFCLSMVTLWLICLMSQSRPVMENWDSLKEKVITSLGKI